MNSKIRAHLESLVELEYLPAYLLLAKYIEEEQPFGSEELVKTYIDLLLEDENRDVKQLTEAYNYLRELLEYDPDAREQVEEDMVNHGISPEGDKTITEEYYRHMISKIHELDGQSQQYYLHEFDYLDDEEMPDDWLDKKKEAWLTTMNEIIEILNSLISDTYREELWILLSEFYERIENYQQAVNSISNIKDDTVLMERAKKFATRTKQYKMVLEILNENHEPVRGKLEKYASGKSLI